MNIIITCRGYSITDSIKSHVENSINCHVGKYVQHNEEANARVILSKEGNSMFTASVSICENHNEFAKASKGADTVYKAIDSAIAHIAGKLRKYKDERIENYRRNRNFKEDVKYKGYLINADNFTDTEITDNSPLIIEEEIPLKTMSVSDAVMEMELLSVPALLFINSRNSKVNMVYVKDNNIIWVDPLDGPGMASK